MVLKFLIATIKKLQERCPLKYPMVKGATCLDPKMLTSSRHAGRLDVALKELVHHEVLSGPEADSEKSDFCQLISDPVCLGKVKDFKKGEHRVDDFWLDDILKDRPRSDPTRKMVSAILILSHGQASVERGFNGGHRYLRWWSRNCSLKSGPITS